MNNPQRLVDRFLAISGEAAVQGSADVGLDDADIDVRHRCEITVQEVVARNDVRDCRNEYLVDEKLRTRALRWTFNYTEVTPQILAIWLAYHLGAQSGPTGVPANEVQTVTIVGDGTLAMTLEGRTVTTKTIPAAATAAELEAALTATHMLFIQPGDVAVTGGASPYTVTFPDTGRLGRANLPIMVATGGVSVAAGTNGANNVFAITRSTTRPKQRFSFVTGWENVTDRFEKYVGYATETLTITAERRQNVGLTVTVVGPWAPEVLTSFSVPACLNPDALVTDDCRAIVDSIWETTDINALSLTLNDSVPVDEASAYGFDSVDIQTLERGDQVADSLTGSVFASEEDNIYDKAFNERTEDTVPIIVHYGMPGDRVSVNIDYAKLKFQDNRIAFVGPLNKSVVNFTATPYRLDANFPIEVGAALDQAVAFLATSP